MTGGPIFNLQPCKPRGVPRDYPNTVLQLILPLSILDYHLSAHSHPCFRIALQILWPSPTRQSLEKSPSPPVTPPFLLLLH
eukprot:767099-Hanusia_phi.AAC.1